MYCGISTATANSRIMPVGQDYHYKSKYEYQLPSRPSPNLNIFMKHLSLLQKLFFPTILSYHQDIENVNIFINWSLRAQLLNIFPSKHGVMTLYCKDIQRYEKVIVPSQYTPAQTQKLEVMCKYDKLRESLWPRS